MRHKKTVSCTGSVWENSLPGRLGKAEFEDGRASDGGIIRDDSAIGRDDDIDGADEFRGDPDGPGTVEGREFRGKTAEEGGVQGHSVRDGSVEGEGDESTRQGRRGRIQCRKSLDGKCGVALGARFDERSCEDGSKVSKTSPEKLAKGTAHQQEKKRYRGQEGSRKIHSTRHWSQRHSGAKRHGGSRW